MSRSNKTIQGQQRTVFECNQDNGECLNDRGYPYSFISKYAPNGNGSRQGSAAGRSNGGKPGNAGAKLSVSEYMNAGVRLLKMSHALAKEAFGEDYDHEDARSLFIQATKAGLVARVGATAQKPAPKPEPEPEPEPPVDDEIPY